MAKDKYHIESLTPELIEKYHQGKLSEDEQYAVEKLMLNSAFESDAMDGFEQHTSLAADLTMLNKQLDARINKERKSTITFWLKIAASVLLLAVCAYFVFDNSFKQTTNEETLALQKNEVDETPSAKEIELKNQEPARTDENETKTEPPQDLIALNKAPIVKDEEMPPITAQPQEVQTPVEEEEFIAMADDTEVEDSNESLSEIIIEPIPEAEKSDVAERQAKRSSIAKSMAIEGVVSKKMSAPSTASSISGKVTSADDGSPLVGVNVVIKGSNVGTVTDLDGNYKIDSLPMDGDTQLEFSFIGLASQEVNVNNRNHLDIAMNSDVRQLSEVVMTRSTGSAPDEESIGYENARPVIDMPQYRSYLKENVKYPKVKEALSGRVVVKFDVDIDGSLNNFEIKKSLGKLYDAEAIRLIKEGPKWQPAISNGQAIESSAKVTVRFNR